MLPTLALMPFKSTLSLELSKVKELLYLLWHEKAVRQDFKVHLYAFSPPEEQFVDVMREIDVRVNDTIVVYDKIGMASAPRAFWMLKIFGVTDVMILNGTFYKWETEKRPIDSWDKEAALRNDR